MQIVIEIDEETYKGIKMGMRNRDDMAEIGEAVENGTLISKGHGRIIDESQITGTFTWDNGFIECFAPTIIEADKAESEE